MFDNFFMKSLRKKLKAAKYSPFETIQLLFETFLNIMKNKGDILKKRINIEIHE